MIKGNKRYLIISYVVFFESSTGAEERPGCYSENCIKWKAPEAVLVLKFSLHLNDSPFQSLGDFGLDVYQAEKCQLSLGIELGVWGRVSGSRVSLSS